MDQGEGMEFWEPENHPWRVKEDSMMAAWSRTAGYDDQWALIAEHVAVGGTVESAARPSMRRYAAFRTRPTLEGIRQARIDAADLVAEGLYDAASILDEVATQRAEDEARDEKEDPGQFELPPNWNTARIHTTVTRLFTHSLVHTVNGARFEPYMHTGRLVPFHGRLHLGGHRDIDTGIELDGEYRVDLIDAGTGMPGSGDPVLRLLWGSEAAVVGAIECGWLFGFGRSGGFGPRGASREIREVAGELPDPGQLALIETTSGISAWCMAGASEGFFTLFLAVDAARTPVGAILDTSNVTQYSWYDEEADDEYSSDWPEGAREFNSETDDEGSNPNVRTVAKPDE